MRGFYINMPNFAFEQEFDFENMEQLTITVKTLFGLEEVLQDEVRELGYDNVKLLNRAVQIEGSWKDVYRLNFYCRIAIAVLVKVSEFSIKDEKDLYAKAKDIDWTNYFEGNKTFAVKGAVFSKLFQNTMYPYLVVKDAIVDVFRENTGERPNVNVASPQVLFDVYIQERNVTISLNTSGVPLFQRGYRQETGEAPINEVLAAGLIRLSGWDRKSTFIDPMCGAGTIAIEAALMAANIPAMIEREHYAFKNFKSYDAEAWSEIYNAANNRPIPLDFPIIASDKDAAMVQKAKRNARIAPIGKMITFGVNDFSEVSSTTKRGTLICNPPYGERIGDEVEELYEQLGDFFKQNMIGFNCWIISSNLDAIKFVGLKPKRKIKVFNGSLECSFRLFEIFEGTKKVKVIKPSIEKSEEAPVTKNVAKASEEKKREEPKKISLKYTSNNGETKKSSKYAVRSSATTDENSGQTELHRTLDDKPNVEKSKEMPKSEKPKINSTAAKIKAMKKYRTRED